MLLTRSLTRDTHPAYAPVPQTLHRYAYVYDNANRLTKVGGVNYTWDNNPTPLRYGDFVAISRTMAARIIYMIARTLHTAGRAMAG